MGIAFYGFMDEEKRLRRELRRVIYGLMVQFPDPVEDTEKVLCEVWDEVLGELRVHFKPESYLQLIRASQFD